LLNPEGDYAVDKEIFLNIFRDSIRAITDRRYFSNERAYQGELLAQVRSRANEKIYPDNAIWEQEYQKKLYVHGINIRPDLILYIPYEIGIYNNHDSGNFVVIQLKRRASKIKAEEDFGKLDLMFEKLNYPLGIFLNIDSNKTFFYDYKGDYPERLHCFAVRLTDHEVVIYEQ
jgi:hypothetical protein